MRFPSKWHLIRHPILYQGWRHEKNYFEGWYFKIVDPDNNLAFALIPGISRDPDGYSHSFIQLMDGVNCKSYYYEFEADEFVAQPKTLDISIGNNQFTFDKIKVDLPEIKVDLQLGEWVRLSTTIFRPGIMGWYSYMPFMQCYHGLGSMHHTVVGDLTYQGNPYKLQNAKGYVEKDWGTSFPKAWIWCQCNTFRTQDNLSVFLSVAHIPWLGSSFIGFLGVLYYKGRMEIFTTYNRSRRQTSMGMDHVHFVFSRANMKLKIKAYRDKGSDLKSPIQGKMTGKVNESMMAKVDLEFKDGSKTIVRDHGYYAGLEVAGPVDILMLR